MKKNYLKRIREDKERLSKKIRSFFMEGFFGNFIVRMLLLCILIFNIACFATLIIFIDPENSPIILHYNVYFGVDLIGDWWQTYLVPAMGVLFAVVNIFLAYYFYEKRERIGSYILLLATLMIQMSCLIASSVVALINY